MQKETRLSLFIKGLIKFCVFGYLAFLVGLMLMQRELVYHPQKGLLDDLAGQAGANGLQMWKDHEGNFLGWVSRPAVGVAKYRCLVFLGNAGNALNGFNYVQAVQALPGRGDWEVYLFEYPGYGGRSGTPSQKNFVDAGGKAVDELRSGDHRPVFLVGDAFGSGVACQVAGARPDEVNGLLLVEPFDNFINVVWSHFPVFPMHHLMEWFMYDQYDSDSALKGYDGPVAVVIAGKEQVVPPELGEALFDGYHGTKRIWVLDDDDHDALVTGTLAGWWQEAFGFLKKYAVVTKG